MTERKMYMTMFGPEYFSKIKKYGLGIGLNPSDAHDVYMEQYKTKIDFFEVTAASARDQGPTNYTEARSRVALPKGFCYKPVDAYASANVTTLLHSTNVNPVYPEPITEPALQELKRLVDQTNTPWVTEDLGIWLMNERHVYPFFMPFPMTADALTVTISNIKTLQEYLGVPFNAEFPPIRLIAGDMHAFEFFRILSEQTGCGMCFDVGHILSYQIERKVSPTADFHLLPWDYVTEVHLAGGNIDLHEDGYHYDDVHGDYDIISICNDMLDTVINLAPNLKAITIEVFGSKHPQSTMKKVESIRNRPSFKKWLNDESPVPIFQSSELDTAKVSVRESIVSIYDALHGPQKLSGKQLKTYSEPFLSGFAVNEQRKWDYERRARIRLHGFNVTSYFPLTTKWLLRRDNYQDEFEFYESIVSQLPGSSVAMWDKIVYLYDGIVHKDTSDLIGHDLFRCETWMNECASKNNTTESMTFAVDILGITSRLNRDLDIPSELMVEHFTTLSHLGECRFGRVNSDFDLDMDPLQTVPTRGRAQCCTGK